MPVYRHFYVEHRGPNGWDVPANYVAEPRAFECDRRFGGVAWVHPSRGWQELFWGANALFAMRPGPPEEIDRSPLLNYLLGQNDINANDVDLCWLPFAELLLDCWETESVTVAANVSPRFAYLFADGEQSFPIAALRRAGAADEEIDAIRDGRLCRHPRLETPKNAAEFGHASRHNRRVTWQTTVAEFVGEPMTALFKSLRRYGDDGDLRLLSRRG